MGLQLQLNQDDMQDDDMHDLETGTQQLPKRKAGSLHTPSTSGISAGSSETNSHVDSWLDDVIIDSKEYKYTLGTDNEPKPERKKESQVKFVFEFNEKCQNEIDEINDFHEYSLIGGLYGNVTGGLNYWFERVDLGSEIQAESLEFGLASQTNPSFH